MISAQSPEIQTTHGESQKAENTTLEILSVFQDEDSGPRENEHPNEKCSSRKRHMTSELYY